MVAAAACQRKRHQSVTGDKVVSSVDVHFGIDTPVICEGRSLEAQLGDRVGGRMLNAQRYLGSGEITSPLVNRQQTAVGHRTYVYALPTEEALADLGVNIQLQLLYNLPVGG